MNNRRKMIKRALWMIALSAPTWEEALRYCAGIKCPEKVIERYISDMIDRALRS